MGIQDRDYWRDRYNKRTGFKDVKGPQDYRYYPKQFRGRRAPPEWQDGRQQDRRVEPWHWTLILMFWCGLALVLFLVFRASGFR